MAEQIFVKNGDTLEPVDEKEFELEDDLQKLLAQEPRLLGNARRWLLVTREKGVADALDGADRWSLDHLFVDQDAIPTLVEVKRGRNSQIRREVVGQMLDYAANGSQFWTQDEIREAFEREHEGSNEPADAVLQEFLGEESTADEFWGRVATNLAARRMRLVFVADAIPPELIRIVEFLNAQMRDIEVLAVEIKQFKGNNQTETLVSRVIGDTAAPPDKNTSARARTKMTMEDFFTRLPNDASVRKAAERLIEVARESGAKVVSGSQTLSIRVDIPKEIWRSPVSVAWFCPERGDPQRVGLRDFSFGAWYPDYGNQQLNGIMNRWVEGLDCGDKITFDSERGRAWAVAHDQVVQNQEYLANALEGIVKEIVGLGKAPSS